jgi:serine/threonine-protein kinase
MVMELLVGMNVHKLLRQLGPLPPELAVRIAVQTCFGLEKAHAAGVVHRDIKPANLFLADADGGERIVKLLDFGVAKFKMDQASEASDGLTRTGSVLGSPMFMSPEQARGLKTIDHRADIWSLGIVLYQLLSGKAPHSGIDGVGELIITICSEEPAPLRTRAPWISPRLEKVVHGALKLAAGARYASATEMREALLDCLSDRTSWHIHQRMLVPLTEEERAARPESPSIVAADDSATVALDPGPLAPRAVAPSSTEATMALDEDALHAPASPFLKHATGSRDAASPTKPSLDAGGKWGATAKTPEARRAAPPPNEPAASRLPLILGIGLGIALGVAAIVFLAREKPVHDHHAVSVAHSSHAFAAATSVAAAPEPAPSGDPVALPTPSASASSATAPTGNRVKVYPPQARVLVDGKQVERSPDGTVPIDGPLNSSHTVAIHWGPSTLYKQVVLTDKGPIPSELFGGTEPTAPGTPPASPAGNATATQAPPAGAPPLPGKQIQF